MNERALPTDRAAARDKIVEIEVLVHPGAIPGRFGRWFLGGGGAGLAYGFGCGAVFILVSRLQFAFAAHWGLFPALLCTAVVLNAALYPCPAAVWTALFAGHLRDGLGLRTPGVSCGVLAAVAVATVLLVQARRHRTWRFWFLLGAASVVLIDGLDYLCALRGLGVDASVPAAVRGTLVRAVLSGLLLAVVAAAARRVLGGGVQRNGGTKHEQGL